MGRVLREGKRATKRVLSISSLSSTTTSNSAMEVARGVERGIRAFNNLVGKEENEEEFHGFTDLDVSAASERAEILRDEGDLLKHDIAEARGAYKFGSPASVQWTFCKTEKKASSKRKKGALSIIEAKRRSIERRYSTEKQSKNP